MSLLMGNSKSVHLDFVDKVEFDQILTNPILDIGARFWEKERYEAFRVCYRSMRIIDDLVDDRKTTGQPLTQAEIDEYRREMTDWLESVHSGQSTDPFLDSFRTTQKRFAIPLWPWERLVKAMSYDLVSDGFSSFLSFLRYTEGAAIAPASVFMHLCGVSITADGRIVPPRYDVRLAARPLAIFSYVVHIIRDFEKDQASNLNYFPSTLLGKYRLDRTELTAIARSNSPTESFRKLIGFYQRAAEFYRTKARKALDTLADLLEPQYLLSLEVIYGLYHQIFERIDPKAASFSTAAMNPSPEQVRARLTRIIDRFANSTTS